MNAMWHNNLNETEWCREVSRVLQAGMAERAGFEPARSWRPLRDFQSRPFVHSGTSPAGHHVRSVPAFTENSH